MMTSQTNKTFRGKVWQYPAGEELMKMSGWVVEGDHVRLRDDSRVKIVSQLLGAELVVKTILGKRSKDMSIGCAAGASSASESLELSGIAAAPITNAIILGHGKNLKELLSQYTCPIQCIKVYGTPLIEIAYASRQIGIVRILVSEYGVDANYSNDGCLSYFKLFVGCDSTDASQSLIIQFIKEFDIDVNKHDECYSALRLAVLHKLFTVIKFLVEECKVDVNCTYKSADGTPLHMAYGMGEENIAQYLIEHGADQDAVDDDGRKPKDYRFYENNVHHITSQYHRKISAILKNFGPEAHYFIKCCELGLSEKDAVDATFKKFPNLQKSFVGFDSLVLDATPTLNELSCYITDMAPSYYDIGLWLGIDNRELKLVKEDHSSFPALEQECRRMLEVWLNKDDTSATWKKLCDALKRQGLNFLARSIRDDKLQS